VTLLYRYASGEQPDFGRRTLWTMHADDAEWLARFEAWDAPTPSPPGRLYSCEVTMGDDIRERDVSDEVRRVSDRSTTLEEFLDWLEFNPTKGYHWVQLVDHQGHMWRGAVLYLGDEPLPARPVPAPG
jgi:hypothetical protein